MIKRGQIYGDLFKYFLIAIIAVMILLFGINAFNKVKNASCRSGLILLENELKQSVKTVSSDIGSISEEVFKIPCDIDKIYFVDLEGDKTKLLNSLNEFPLIQDAIKESVEKNAFLVKGNKVVESFYAGDIDLQKPYFVCSNTARGNLGLYLGGKGTSTELVNKECAFDCTFEVINISEGIAEELIGDAINFGCQGCPKGTLYEEMDRFRETNKVVKIARRCNCGRKPGETVVEILIKPEGTLEHFKLIEKIPKDYVDDLDEFIKSIHGNYTYFKIKSDPLIMWHFNEISKETIVQYTIEKDILEYCADVFKTIGLGVTLESEGLDPQTTPETELDKIKDDPPILNLPDNVIEIKKGESNSDIFNRPVWYFVSDPDLMVKKEEKEAKFKDYIYQISYNDITYSNSVTYSPTGAVWDYIKCLINDKRVNCEVGNDFSETSHTFFIKVTDPDDKSAVDKFKITIFDCSKLNEIQCGQKPSDCDWCPKCDINNKWNGYANNICVNKGTCSYTDGTDNDGDGFNVECDNDCSDDLSNPNSIRIPNSANSFCDCNPSDGFTNGTEEKENLCFDNIDNNCDGAINGCSKLKCTKKVVDGDCIAKFDDECSSKGWRGRRTDRCWYKGWFGDKYVCYDDWETECMENPSCKDGNIVETTGCCSSNANCNDNNPCTGDSCSIGKCEHTNLPDGTACSSGTCKNGFCILPACRLESAYWDRDSAKEGDVITLTVEGDNNCNYKTANFEVWEDDISAFDPSLIPTIDQHIKPDPASSTFSCNNGCTAETTWEAKYVDDWGDPEYFLRAIVDDNGIISKGNGDGNVEILEVVPALKKLHCYSPYLYPGCHETCKCPGHCWESYGNHMKCQGCHKQPICKSGEETAWCYYDDWTQCSIKPECPTNTGEINRIFCCIDNDDCNPGEICVGEDCVKKVASLTATITTTSKSVSGGYTYYYYDLVIKESNGVGVKLNHARDCFKTYCRSWDNKDRIVPANGQYTGSSYWYWSNLESNEYWAELEGSDDNGNSISVTTNKLIHPS